MAEAAANIVFSAIMTQPLAHGPDWPRLARRQVAIYLAGIAADAPAGMPGPRSPARTSSGCSLPALLCVTAGQADGVMRA